MAKVDGAVIKEFLSTPSARRATIQRVSNPPDVLISIHALREEGDQFFDHRDFIQHDFYPRPPRGGRPRRGIVTKHEKRISIHALREEGDGFRTVMRA